MPWTQPPALDAHFSASRYPNPPNEGFDQHLMCRPVRKHRCREDFRQVPHFDMTAP